MESLIAYLNAVFFGLDQDQGILKVLEHLFVFLAACALIFYLLYLVLSKTTSGSAEIHRDHALRLNLLQSLVAFQVVYAVYLFFFVRANGLEKFQWERWQFYLALLPQMLVFFGIALLYYSIHTSFIQKLKSR